MFDTTIHPFTSYEEYEIDRYTEEFVIDIVCSDAESVKLIYSIDLAIDPVCGDGFPPNEIGERLEYFGRILKFLVLSEASKFNLQNLISCFVAQNHLFIENIQNSLGHRARKVQLKVLEMQLVGVFLSHD